MKQKFVITGKGETKTKITVEVETSKYVLRREELTRYKKELQDEIHTVLKNKKYYVSDISLK